MADLAVPPLLIVGWEGVFGTAIMALIMLPIVYFLPGVDGEGLHENSIETLHVSDSPPPKSHLKRLSYARECCNCGQQPRICFYRGIVSRFLQLAERVCFAMQMLVHSAPLLTVILVDMAALLLYNYAGMCVTGEDLQPDIWTKHPWTHECALVLCVLLVCSQ